ncbi:DNA/RNA non-specific endonuclease [uncultured Cellulomonas sp.]|uniref:DNA/RNA non-specific endonuclease n=1 Tax=uncultured Cellulomonas sp. TaxID=189682 RepID=UPI0026037799|nr:DNA/RNA non-specific endonuclease [uncultured Cellulomonas sp.]
MSYDPSFLTWTVPLPRPAADDGDDTGTRTGTGSSAGTPGGWVQLSYPHFTVQLDPARRLAAATAVNVDGARLLDLPRAGLDWFLDERVPASAQVGQDVYARNDLDRGHLVRRRDPVWGEPAVAAAANAATFCFTNAAPQAAVFNQSKDLWLGLEDYLLEHADATDTRLTVLTGPVLDAGDPVYRGVQVPRAFWKVAVWAGPAGLAATAYLLDQSDLLVALLDRERVRGTAADAGPAATTELGAYRTFQVPVLDVATTAGLDLGPLPAADRLGVRAAAARPAGGAIELTSVRDLVL